MKKLTIILILMAATVIHAQKEGDYPGVEKMRERVKAERIAFITEKVALTTDEAQKFWPVYNSFSTEIENMRKELRSLRMNRVKNLEKLSEKELDESFAKELALLDKQNSLLKDNHNNIRKVLPAAKVALLYDAEKKFKMQLMRKIKERKESFNLEED
jgi:hypothetical protein